jgi:hypothetical protein
LIEAIKKRLISPPDKDVPYNLKEDEEFFPMTGQWNQVLFLF